MYHQLVRAWSCCRSIGAGGQLQILVIGGGGHRHQLVVHLVVLPAPIDAVGHVLQGELVQVVRRS